ncbi:MAG TPA: hypothetical protein VF530_10955 [Planctomycetota bacterium]
MSDWRARRSGAEPDSVAGVVLAVRAALRLTRLAECVLLFVAALLLTRAAALVSGLAGAELTAAWGVALLCGALCAAAWWLEHPQGARATARALDQRLRHHGALVTAFELETRAARSPMEALVSARVLARLRTGEALRALVPPLLLPVAAPSLAALALVLAVDARRAPPPRALDFMGLAEGLDQALALGTLDEARTGLAGEDPEGGLSRRQVQALGEVLHGRGALPYSAEAWQADPEAARAAVARLDRRVAELARELEPGSELSGRLAEARVWLDALRMGLAAGAPEGPGGTEGSGGETPGAADGRISGSRAPAEVAPSSPAAMSQDPAPDAALPTPALGRQAGRWWPAEYDAVVARWLELAEASAPR